MAEISGVADVPERSGQLVVQTPYPLGNKGFELFCNAVLLKEPHNDEGFQLTVLLLQCLHHAPRALSTEVIKYD
ncbi:hypothetical protein J6590_068777 [Homalodisca vitripennis]|nr:hypothetical protein J6590_068777 [Homalodisca vitripennis]